MKREPATERVADVGPRAAVGSDESRRLGQVPSCRRRLPVSWEIRYHQLMAGSELRFERAPRTGRTG